MRNSSDLKSLSTVPLKTIIKYFQSFNWQIIEPAPFKDIAILRKIISDKEKEILLPYDQTFFDFYERIFVAINEFAKFENKVLSDIISELLSFGSDILKLRISGKNIHEGIIPFLEEMSLKDGLKKILSSIACQINNPRPFYKKLYRADAEHLLKHSQLGVPEKGSYIIKFYFPPLDSNYSPETSRTAKPFARQVAEQLMISLQDLVKCVENKEPANIPSKFNANFCFGLAEMTPNDSSNDLDFELIWNEEVPVDRTIPKQVHIQENYMPEILQIGERLKPKREIMQSDFIGKITDLHGCENEEGKMEGDITVTLLVDEESKKARAFLNTNFYSQACDAHKNGKYIKISGIFKEKPRLNILEDVSNFEVVSK